jgi:hypothetical protein
MCQFDARHGRDAHLMSGLSGSRSTAWPTSVRYLVEYRYQARDGTMFAALVSGKRQRSP